jgi:hypothetical protein
MLATAFHVVEDVLGNDKPIETECASGSSLVYKPNDPHSRDMASHALKAQSTIAGMSFNDAGRSLAHGGAL